MTTAFSLKWPTPQGTAAGAEEACGAQLATAGMSTVFRVSADDGAAAVEKLAHRLLNEELYGVGKRAACNAIKWVLFHPTFLHKESHPD